MVTVFLSILNQMDFHLVQNRKENCHRDHIPFNVKGIGSIVFSVYVIDRVIDQCMDNASMDKRIRYKTDELYGVSEMKFKNSFHGKLDFSVAWKVS